MNVINLETLEGLPNKYIEKLSTFTQEFMYCEFLEDLAEKSEIQELIYDINQFCLQNIIIGFHFTKAEPKHILEKGLLSRTGKEIREEFLVNFGKEFNSDEVSKIKSAWKYGFDDFDKKARDNKIYFNFTKKGLKNGGADLLLKNIGGEQVYSPLYLIEELQAKIQNLGVPLIVKCKLTPNKIRTLIEYPWGKIATSSFHRTVNPEAHQIDQDGYQKTPVSPELIEIVEW